jgi:hypothetical protein
VAVSILSGRKAASKQNLGSSTLGPGIYSPRFDAVEAKRGKMVQRWNLKSTPISPTPLNAQSRLYSVLKKEVKSPKKGVSREEMAI